MSVGANCFLFSSNKVLTIGPNPSTERGKSLHINAHPTLPLIIYPSGKFIVVKNVENPNECFVYRGHSVPTTVAKFSPNGYWVASADTSGKVRVWSWDNPEHLTKLETSVFAGPVADIDWDCEAKKIVAVGEGSGILVKCITWDTGNSAGEMLGHNKRVLSVAYRPVRPFRVLTASEDMKSLCFAGPPFKLDHSNSCHSNFVNCIRYSPDGLKAVSVGSDKKIQAYVGASGDPAGEVVNAHEGGIYSVSFSPDSKHFLTASADKTVKLWDAESLALEQTFTFAEDPQIGDAQVAVLWTARHMLSVSLNGDINILDRNSSARPSRVLQGHQTAISAMHVDAEAGLLYTGSCDGVVCVRSLLAAQAGGVASDATKFAGSDRRSLCGAAHSNKVVGLVSLAGSSSLLSAGWDDALRVADCVSRSYHADSALASQPCTLSSARGSSLLLVVLNSEVALYRGSDKVASIGAAALGFVPTCGALLGEEEVAVGGADCKTHVFAIGSGLEFALVAQIETRSAVTAVAYSPRGDALAIGDAGRQVEVYERGSWAARVKGKWVFHTSKVTSLAWSPSGAFLASGSLDENIFVWSCERPASKIQLAYAHMGGVTDLGWFGEAQLVSVGNDHTVVTWSIPAQW